LQRKTPNPNQRPSSDVKTPDLKTNQMNKRTDLNTNFADNNMKVYLRIPENTGHKLVSKYAPCATKVTTAKALAITKLQWEADANDWFWQRNMTVLMHQNDNLRPVIQIFHYVEGIECHFLSVRKLLLSGPTPNSITEKHSESWRFPAAADDLPSTSAL
jgi:hypothetical protein